MSTDVDIKQWLADRKREGLEIDPETAELTWVHGYTLDPYGIYEDLTEEEKQIDACISLVVQVARGFRSTIYRRRPARNSGSACKRCNQSIPLTRISVKCHGKNRTSRAGGRAVLKLWATLETRVGLERTTLWRVSGTPEPRDTRSAVNYAPLPRATGAEPSSSAHDQRPDFYGK
jgi:hypothetical protein